MSNSKLAKDLLEAVRQENGTKPYDTTAEVLRVENGIAWIHIDGGASETPCELTIDAKAGDKVKVRIAGGSAWLIGNATAPPTDDTQARNAKATADIASDIADSAQKDAETAMGLASDAAKTAKNYITEIDDGGIRVHDADDLANYVRIDSDGMGVYVAGDDVAHYGSETRIGKEQNAAKVVIGSDSIEMYTEEGNLAFQVLVPENAETEYQEVTKTYSTATYRVVKTGVTTSNTTTTGTFSLSDLNDVEADTEPVCDFNLFGLFSTTVANYGQVGNDPMDYTLLDLSISRNGNTKQGTFDFTFSKNGTQQSDSKSFSLVFGNSSILKIDATVSVSYDGNKTFTVTLTVKKTQSSKITATVNAYTSLTKLVCTLANVPVPETDIFGDVYLNPSGLGDTYISGDLTVDGDVTFNSSGYSIANPGEFAKAINIKTTSPTPTITANTNSSTGVPGCSVVNKGLSITNNGKVATLYLTVKNTSAKAAGANLFKGTLGNYKPNTSCFGIGYYSSSALIGQISYTGEITVRVIGAQVAANAEVSMSFTYVLA